MSGILCQVKMVNECIFLWVSPNGILVDCFGDDSCSFTVLCCCTAGCKLVELEVAKSKRDFLSLNEALVPDPFHL